jgi:DNA-binding response OmpR family regulator
MGLRRAKPAFAPRESPQPIAKSLEISAMKPEVVSADGTSHRVESSVESGRLRVFLAEDDLELRRLIASALRRDGHLVLESSDGTSLLLDLGGAYLHQGAPDMDSVIISDIRMPGRDGLSVLRSMRQHDWCPPFILITAFGDPNLHQEALRLGALAIFDKPFELGELREAVRRLARSPRSSDALA